MSDAPEYLRTLNVVRLDAYADQRLPLLAQYLAMTVTNCAYLAQHRDAPRLFASGVVYAREAALDGPAEILRDIPSVLRDGWGDCDDLACWRAAELCARGRRARPELVSGGRAARYHVVVRDLDTGRLHDPSARLGMHDRTGDPRHAKRRTMHGATF